MSLGFQVIYAGRSCLLSRQGHCIAMLASGVSLPGMRCTPSVTPCSYGVTDGVQYVDTTPQKPTLFDCHYLRNHSTLDIGVLGYIGIVQHKEHSPEVLSIPPGTPCIKFCSYRAVNTCHLSYQKERQCTYNLTLGRVRAIIVAVEKQ